MRKKSVAEQFCITGFTFYLLALEAQQSGGLALPARGSMDVLPFFLFFMYFLFFSDERAQHVCI